MLISDDQFKAYFKHQKSLKRKLLSKQRSRAKTVTAEVHAPSMASAFSSPSPPLVFSEAPRVDSPFYLLQ